MLSFRYLKCFYGSRVKEFKEAVRGTAQTISKDAQSAASSFKSSIQDDFRAIGQAVADSSDKIGESTKKTYGTSKDTVKNVIDSTKSKVDSAKQSAQNTIKSAERKAKDAAIRAQNSSEGYSEPSTMEFKSNLFLTENLFLLFVGETIAQKVENMAESVVGKGK